MISYIFYRPHFEKEKLVSGDIMAVSDDSKALAAFPYIEYETEHVIHSLDNYSIEVKKGKAFIKVSEVYPEDADKL